jgi:hypothetical protein
MLSVFMPPLPRETPAPGRRIFFLLLVAAACGGGVRLAGHHDSFQLERPGPRRFPPSYRGTDTKGH